MIEATIRCIDAVAGLLRATADLLDPPHLRGLDTEPQPIREPRPSAVVVDDDDPDALPDLPDGWVWLEDDLGRACMFGMGASGPAGHIRPRADGRWRASAYALDVGYGYPPTVNPTRRAAAETLVAQVIGVEA
jgi:hypothetical protein